MNSFVGWFLCIFLAFPMVLASVGICPRPNGCQQTTWDQTYQMIDCDGDGIPDNVCSQSNGRLWYTSSRANCADSNKWTEREYCWHKGSGMEEAVRICPRPKSGCSFKDQATYLLLDCDGDGIPDNVCSGQKGRLWYTSSMAGPNGCLDEWQEIGRCYQKELPKVQKVSALLANILDSSLILN